MSLPYDDYRCIGRRDNPFRASAPTWLSAMLQIFTTEAIAYSE